MSAPVRLMVCVALLLVTLGDAAAQKRGMGGALRQRCMQETSGAHPLGTSPECQRFNARMGRCQTYIRGNAPNAMQQGLGQLRRCMRGRPDPNLTHFGAAEGGNMPPGPGRRRRAQ
jgi:hypothetical protein